MPAFPPASALGILAALALGAGATAGEVRSEARAVIELFTSQGCSSCPPADALLEELGARSDIIALGYHVDYWDYIGWEDTFGSPSFSDLQRGYARSFGESSIYTPQLVVNGETHAVGSRRDEVMAALEGRSLVVPVSMVEDGDYVDIAIGAGPAGPDAVVWLVTFLKSAEVEIRRGENGGRRLAYSHVVTSRQVLGMYDPAEGAELRLPLLDALIGEADGLVILIQLEDGRLPSRVIGAASLTR